MDLPKQLSVHAEALFFAYYFFVVAAGARPTAQLLPNPPVLIAEPSSKLWVFLPWALNSPRFLSVHRSLS